MNNFTQAETESARLLYMDATRHANSYAEKKDVSAATVALLLTALELAGVRVCQDCKCVCKNEN